jgi:deoxyguanosine kinase
MGGPTIISIEGNIGSGKSTLLKYLSQCCEGDKEFVFLQEPVDAWDTIKDEQGVTMLAKFYQDQQRYAFSFQMMAYISRLALLKKTCDENPNAIIVTERSLYTDKHVFAKMLYDTKCIEEVEYKIYLNWFHTFADDYPISKFIYVNADPPTCFGRIMVRSRKGESSIDVGYLEKCGRYHNTMLLNEYMDKCVVINGNDNFRDMKDEWVDIIKKYMVRQ